VREWISGLCQTLDFSNPGVGLQNSICESEKIAYWAYARLYAYLNHEIFGRADIPLNKLRCLAILQVELYTQYADVDY
jgi:hypothetical protein